MRVIIKQFILGVVLLASFNAWALNHDSSHLFGYQEFEKSNLSMFPQWLSVLERHVKNLAQTRDCKSSTFNRCDLKEWLAFLDGLRGLSRQQQIEKVNHFANQKAYVLDIENYGVADYWATPKEFLINSGDCEDYAIIKMLSMKWLGYDVNKMRIVIVQDTNLHTPHAVMSIARAGDIYILDNQVPEVMSHHDIYHYVPVYSLNEKHWWMHVPEE